MPPMSPELIEKYQLLYEEDPNSKVFVQLSQGYREMGLLDQAYSVCSTGVQKNPDYPGGHVALAQCLITLNLNKDAKSHLLTAIELSPDNLLAYSLLADLHIKDSNLSEALSCYKMLLFLNPTHLKAQNAVKKLESLSAADFDNDEFELQNFSKSKPSDTKKPEQIKNYDTHRALSLADAYYARGEIKKSIDCLTQALIELGPVEELQKRKNWFENKQAINEESLNKPDVQKTADINVANNQNTSKIKYLRHLLHKVHTNKK